MWGGGEKDPWPVICGCLFQTPPESGVTKAVPVSLKAPAMATEAIFLLQQLQIMGNYQYLIQDVGITIPICLTSKWAVSRVAGRLIVSIDHTKTATQGVGRGCECGRSTLPISSVPITSLSAWLPLETAVWGLP